MADAVVFEGGVGGEGVRLAGEAVELGLIKSSMFMSSGLKLDLSFASRSWAIPEGAPVRSSWLLREGVSCQPKSLPDKSEQAIETYRACCSLSLRFRFIAIIRHVKLSMRSWLGSWALVRL